MRFRDYLFGGLWSMLFVANTVSAYFHYPTDTVTVICVATVMLCLAEMLSRAFSE